MAALAPDPHTPVTREDVTDEKLLPRRFEAFASEMRLQIERVLLALKRIADGQADLRDGQKDLERRLRALEPAPFVPSATRGETP